MKNNKLLRDSIISACVKGQITYHKLNDKSAFDLVKSIHNEHIQLLTNHKIHSQRNDVDLIFKNNSYVLIENHKEIAINEWIVNILPPNWTLITQKELFWLDNGVKTSGETLPILDANFLRTKQNPIYKNSGVIVSPNDVVILVDGNAGEIFIPHCRGYMGSTFKILRFTKLMNFEFLLLILKSNQTRYKNNQIIPHLDKVLFRNDLAMVPPLEEQNRIVEKIKKLEPLVDEYEKLKEKRNNLDAYLINQLRSSVVKAAIKGKLTKRLECTDVDKSLAEMKKEKNNKIIHSNEKEKFDIPSTWRWVCLSNIVKSINAGTDKPEHFSESKNEKFNIPVYGNGEYNDGLIGYTDKATIFEKALTISARGTIGFSKVRNEPFVPIVRLLVLRSLPETNLSWISYALMGLMEYGNGSVIKQLTVPMISHKLIPFPPLEEQKHIVEVLDKIFIKISDLKNIFSQNLNNLNYKK